MSVQNYNKFFFQKKIHDFSYNTKSQAGTTDFASITSEKLISLLKYFYQIQ